MEFFFIFNFYLEKFAIVCKVFAAKVSLRAAFSCGYSCVRLNKLGDSIAGHMKRKNMLALIRVSHISSVLPCRKHSLLKRAKTCFISTGKFMHELNTRPHTKWSICTSSSLFACRLAWFCTLLGSISKSWLVSIIERTQSHNVCFK